MALSKAVVVRLLRDADGAVAAIKAAANAAEISVRVDYLNAHPTRGWLRAIRRRLTRRY